MNYIPQTGSLRRPVAVWLFVAMGSALILLMIVGAPLALNAGRPLPGFTLYQAFSLVCHQLPERSFFIGTNKFAVCSRCTGLYAGFALATWFYPLVRSLRRTEAPPRRWLFVAAAPLLIDFSLTFFGLWDNTHSTRFISGGLLGAVAVFYVMPGLMDLSMREWGKPPTNVTPVRTVLNPSVSAPSDYSAPHRRI